MADARFIVKLGVQEINVYKEHSNEIFRWIYSSSLLLLLKPNSCRKFG